MADFEDTEYGQDALDAISMRLQFIGESLKKVENYRLQNFIRIETILYRAYQLKLI